jgi:hypothetical protein
MSITKCNCCHIVSLTGEPVGLISLQDICKYLIVQEAKQKISLAEVNSLQTPLLRHGYGNNFSNQGKKR